MWGYVYWGIFAVVGVAALIEGWKIGGIPMDLAEKLRRENRDARKR